MCYTKIKNNNQKCQIAHDKYLHWMNDWIKTKQRLNVKLLFHISSQ